MAECGLCPPGNYIPEGDEGIYGGIERVLKHLQEVHPEVYGDGPERWPDGRVVVTDTTLEPKDFDQ